MTVGRFELGSAWVGVHADVSGLREEIRRGVGAATAGLRADVNIGANVDNTSVQRVRALINASVAHINSTVHVNIDNRTLINNAQAAGAAAGSRFASSFGSSLGSLDFLPLSPAFLALAAALVPAAGAAGMLASSLGLASASMVAAIPAAFGLAGALSTVTLGFGGVLTALKAHTAMSKQAATSAVDLGRQQAASAKQLREAEERAADAKYRLLETERALNDARKEAAKRIEELTDAARNAALDEEDVALRLEEATNKVEVIKSHLALVTGKYTALDLKRALFEEEKAQADLTDATEKKAEAQQAANEAATNGVEGAKNVIDATRNHELAVRELSDAQQDLNDAQAAGGVSASRASAAANQYEAALAKLSPTGRAFVEQLISMRVYLDQLRRTAETTMLPGFLDFLRDAVVLFPIVNEYMGRFGRAIGGAAAEVGALVTTPLFGTQLRSVLEANASAADHFGRSAAPMTRILMTVSEAAASLVDRFAAAWENGTKMLANWLDLKRESGELADFFKRAGDEMSKWWDIVSNTVVGLVNILRAANPAGREMASSLRDITQRFADWTGSTEGQNKLRGFFDFILHINYGRIAQTAAAVAALGLAIKGLVLVQGLANGVKGLVTFITATGGWGALLIPVALAVAGLATAFGLLYMNSKDVRDMVGEVWRAFRSDLQPVADRFYTWIVDRVVPKIREYLIPALREIKDFLIEYVIPAVAEMYERYLPKLQEAFTTITNAIDDNKAELKQLWEWLSTIAGFVIQNFLPALANVAGFMVTTFADSLANAIRVIGFVVDAVTRVVNAFKAMKDLIVGVWNSIPMAMVTGANAIIDFINGLITKINTILPKDIPTISHVSVIGSNAGAPSPDAQPGTVRFMARGGLLAGPGTGTSDSIPIMASSGEYVLPANSVSALMARYGRGFLEGLRTFGSIGGDPSRMTVRGYADGGLISRTQAFITGTDPLPYIWGAVGPYAYDCSGLVGQVWAMLTGHPSFRRYFTTETLPSAGGFKPGHGAFTIGLSPTHVVGNLAGLAFEAANSRAGIRIGSSATSVDRMPRQYYLPQVGDQFIGGGSGGSLAGLVRAIIDRTVAGFIGTLNAFTPKGLGGYALRGVFDNVTSSLRATSFDRGGLLLPGPTLALNGTGQPERVLGPGQSAAAGGITVEHLNVTIPARDLAEMRTITDFFARIQREARRQGAALTVGA